MVSYLNSCRTALTLAAPQALKLACAASLSKMLATLFFDRTHGSSEETTREEDKRTYHITTLGKGLNAVHFLGDCSKIVAAASLVLKLSPSNWLQAGVIGTTVALLGLRTLPMISSKGTEIWEAKRPLGRLEFATSAIILLGSCVFAAKERSLLSVAMLVASVIPLHPILAPSFWVKETASVEERPLQERRPLAEHRLLEVPVDRPTHIKARTEKGAGYPDRFPVSAEMADWETPFPDYAPVRYVALSVLHLGGVDTNPKPDWADNEEFTGLFARSIEGYINFDATTGEPLNPRGRTGMCGRGLLGRYGPNHAADPVIFRIGTSALGQLQLEILAGVRGDASARAGKIEFALPGGMVDPKDGKMSVAARNAAKRECGEETGVAINLDDAECVYEGYVDDPRNTDNAWMETRAYGKLLSEEQGGQNPAASDDLADASWRVVNAHLMEHLYASHAEIVAGGLRGLLTSTDPRLTLEIRAQITALLPA